MGECEYLIAVGASAGGLDPCERFFDEAPTDKGFAYVVIQHLSPDFRSLMDELLARHSSMPIHRVEDGMQVEPNTIYLNRPRQILTVAEGKFVVSPDEGDDILRLPIDSFFDSMAIEFKERAVGVVLSGSGSDGARGAREIKKEGGRVFVQSPDSAKFESMPMAVVNSSIADGIAPPDKLPELISRHLLGKEEDASLGHRKLTGDPYIDIMNLLQERFGTDFNFYKSETIKRRLERRLELTRHRNLEEYFKVLVENQAETEILYSDLLIEVTSFFRDEEAFRVVKNEVIPTICAEMSRDKQIRMWVPGCASGEEAYSLSMLVAEYAREKGLHFNLKILATDIHQRSLSAASAGIYNIESLSKISDEQRERYFEQVGDYFQVRPNLRRAVVFSPHDLLRDPPFTRMDLVSCRNVMIYLTEEAQRKLLTLFHFSLRKSGVLFLGPSETTGKLSHEFSPLSQRWRIFEKRRNVRIFDTTSLPSPDRGPSRTDGLYSPSIRRSNASLEQRGGSGANAPGVTEALNELLKQYGPPGFLVNTDGQLIHIFGDARKYLSFSSGAFNSRLDELLSDQLKPDVAAMLERFKHGIVAEHSRAVTMMEDGVETHIKLGLRQLPTQGGTLSDFAVLVLEEGQPQKKLMEVAGRSSPEDDELISSYANRVSELERALQSNEETLQSTIEEMETSNEELQATNEELMSANEELQSTNEELHSVNEELYTVSAEHQRKIEELTEVTSDMDHLLKSTNIGTVFLDADFHVRRFTPAAANTFNLIAQDVGRPFAHVTARFTGLDMTQVVREVQRTRVPADHEVTADDRAYLVRVLPYVADNDVEPGVVITTVDINDLKLAQTKITEITRFQTEVLRDIGHLVLRWEKDTGEISFGNAAFGEMFGVSEANIIGQTTSTYFSNDRWADCLERASSIELGSHIEVEFEVVDAQGVERQLGGLIRAIGTPDSNVLSFQFSGRDITDNIEYLNTLVQVLNVESQIKAPPTDKTSSSIDGEIERIDDLLRIAKRYLGAESVYIAVDGKPATEFMLNLKELAPVSELPEGAFDLLERSKPPHARSSAAFGITSLDPTAGSTEQEFLETLEVDGLIYCPIVAGEKVTGRLAFTMSGLEKTDAFFSELQLSLVQIISQWVSYLWERHKQNYVLHRTSYDLQLIFDNVSALIWYKDDQHKILRQNQAAEEFMSFAMTDQNGMPGIVVDGSVTNDTAIKELEVIKSGKPLLGSVESYQTGDDDVVWMRTDRIPYTDPETNSQNLLVVATEVTELKQHEDELIALNAKVDGERELHRRLYLDTPAMMFSTGEDMKIRNANQLLSEVVGFSRDEIIAQSFDDFFSEIDPESLTEMAEAFPEVKNAFQNNYLLRRSKADPIEVELSGVADGQTNGDPQTLWVVRDVTARNTALKSLNDQNEDLAKLNDGLAQFAYAASHDLQEPLRKISQYGDLLISEYRASLDKDGQFFVDVMTSSAQRMSSLIKNLLMFSSTAQTDLKTARVPLDKLATQACDEYKDLVEKVGADIQIGWLPKVTCDAELVQLVLTNIITNALKYHAPRRKSVIKIDAKADNPSAPTMYSISISDNGIGFDAGNAERIFEPFARLVPKSKVKGSGIGLAICKTICERHGWSLSAQALKGKGATFTIEIPVKPDDD